MRPSLIAPSRSQSLVLQIRYWVGQPVYPLLVSTVNAPFERVDCAFLAAICALVNVAVLRPEREGGESRNDRWPVVLNLPISDWFFVRVHSVSLLQVAVDCFFRLA